MGNQMTTTHVFIVDTNTFKYHLEYLFAGTGAKELNIDFNNCCYTNLNHKVEDNLVAMLADSQRIRQGEFIIFYLQQNYKQNVFEGKFYGIFKAKEDLSFLDNNDSQQYLKNLLNKSLTFRTLIEPYEVYSKGVTEWEALDEIKYIQSPNQMLWSLIYRKLKGNRGNTMITIYESERLFQLLRKKNNNKSLQGQNFTFDIINQEIIISNTSNMYSGRKVKINILPRLIEKFISGRSFEPHLQAYIVQNIGVKTNKSLDEALLNYEGDWKIEWIGNEVSCGVGMQRIDLMISLSDNDTKRIIIPIELKSVEANPNNIIQIQRYIDWIDQYYIPNRISLIQPVLIAKEIIDKNSLYYNSVINSFINFNNNNCLPLKYIEFKLLNDNLHFQLINY